MTLPTLDEKLSDVIDSLGDDGDLLAQKFLTLTLGFKLCDDRLIMMGLGCSYEELKAAREAIKKKIDTWNTSQSTARKVLGGDK